MATQNSTLTQEQVKSLFDYKDGELYWKSTKKLSALLNQDGYKRSYINGKTYYNHRIVWLLHYGSLPKQLDHIDGNPANNCIENLREASYEGNNRNKKIPKHNKSGYKNVYFAKSANMWRVQFSLNKKSITVGYFKDLELAGLVAQMAREKYHGNFARHE
jgi:hypothetical protein